MTEKITIDYDDLVGGFLVANAPKREKYTAYHVRIARKQVKDFLSYIEQWQEMQITLESLEDGQVQSNDKR